jgi:hypothetical protein
MSTSSKVVDGVLTRRAPRARLRRPATKSGQWAFASDSWSTIAVHARITNLCCAPAMMAKWPGPTQNVTAIRKIETATDLAARNQNLPTELRAAA